MSDYCLLEREGIDELRNKSFLDLLRDKDGKAVAADQEHALMCLAACLGLIPPGCDNWKDVLYCRDPMTNMLGDILKRMGEAGLLKYDAENHVYLPVDLMTARFVQDDRGDAAHVERSYELRDTKLFWPDDLHRAINNDEIWYVEEGPEPGRRWRFTTQLYWSQVYPK
jgi:hypothetical protein